MASPFSIFRKHQKSLMVVLVIGSMIAFTGESLFTGGGDGWILLGVLLGTTIALAAGFRFGRPAEYAIGGALLGGLIGFVGPKIVGQPGVQSELGVFDDQRIGDLIAKRSAANSFISELQRRALGQGGGGPFGLRYQNTQDDVIFGEMLRAEAKDVGIYIDDDAVTEFINEQTSRKLKPEDFKAVRKLVTINNRVLSEKQLYNLLRDEIQATVAYRILAPSGVERNFLEKPRAATPDEYWTMFKRMNTRQQLAFAAVPVDSFLGAVSDPSDTELNSFFEEYKDKLPNMEPGSPGFYQPQQVKLAYVEIDYDTVAATVADPTEDEIKKYYEENKEQFVEDQLPEDPSMEEDLPTLDEIEKENKEEATPAAETPASAGGEPKPPAEGGGDDKPAGTEGEEEPVEEKSDEGNGCDVFQEESEESAETEEGDAQSEEPQKKTDELPIPPAPLSVPDAEVTDKDPFELPKKYKPLDADLTNQIRNTLKSQKISEKMAEMSEAALNEMKKLSMSRDEHERKNLGEEIDMTDFDIGLCKAVKEYADANGISYAETPLVTGMELLDSQEYPIGSALPPGSQFQRVPNVVQTLFGAGGTPLFNPAPVELQTLNGRNQFVYWVLADIPAHAPKDLEEVGIREKVVKAWKRQEARPLAEERAKALAESVKDKLSEDDTLSSLLEKQTITGDETSAKLTVTESLPFSWIRTSSAPNPMSFQQPTASVTQISGIEGQVTDEFMKILFDELAPGEVGVAPNIDRSVYYVVQPLNRFPTEQSDIESARERFLKTRHFNAFSSAMPGLVRQGNNEVNNTWVRGLWKKYGFDLGT